MISLYWQLFVTYFKIGLFNFGGGYAMLSLIQHEMVDNHHWITTNEFADIIAISQMTPGPIGINCATYVGYQSAINTHIMNGGASDFWGYLYGVIGSAVATTAVVLPSFILLMAIAKILLRYAANKNVQYLFSGLRPTIVGLIGASAILLMDESNFGNTQYELIRTIAICAAVFVGGYKYKVNPITLMLLSGAAGLLLFQ